jgi:hypothetical protein
MPRRPRLSTGGIAYHVLNRRVGRLELFADAKGVSAKGVKSAVCFLWSTSREPPFELDPYRG